MTVFLWRTAVVPTWLIVVGIVALLSPSPSSRMAVTAFVAALVIATAVVVVLAMHKSSSSGQPFRADQTPTPDLDAGDLNRMDSDKG
jgi:hypothetical protein